MTATPWGDADTLRERQLRPGPGVPREVVEENQRQRLYAATVAEIGGKGYLNASISDVIDVAGVSRGTFYKYFEDKESCFLATLDEIIADAVTLTEAAVAKEEEPEARLRRAVTAFVDLAVAQPDAARLCIVEAYAAGPAAVRKVDGALDQFVVVARRMMEGVPALQGTPEEMLRAMIGALRKLMQNRLQRSEEERLPELVQPFLELIFSWAPPPRPLRDSWARSRREETPVPPPLDAAERIERATVEVVARKGFGAAAIADIAGAAGVSNSTFYSIFDDKTAALAASLYRARLRMTAVVLPAYRNARSWPEATRATILAGLDFLELETDLARLLTTEVYGAGAAALEVRDTAIDAFGSLVREAPAGDPDNPVLAEAIEGGAYSLFAEWVLAGRSGELRGLAPLLTYIVLVPFLGAEDAVEVASGGVPGESQD